MKRYDLSGRVIVITGSTGGLGRAAAQALRKRGAKLALFDLDVQAAKRQATELGDARVAQGWAADVCSMESLERAMSEAARHFGGIDVVIANAGVGYTEPMETMTSRSFERTIDVNLNGVWRTFKTALPHVQERQGYMLAISSMAAFVNAPLNAHYAASKAGVLAMCNSLRLEVKHLGVGVGTLHPTFFKTPMMDALMDSVCSEFVFNSYKGIWAFVELDKVIAALVSAIHERRDIVTVPERNALVARATGLIRPIIEKIGFSDARIAEAIRRSEEQCDHR